MDVEGGERIERSGHRVVPGCKQRQKRAQCRHLRQPSKLQVRMGRRRTALPRFPSDSQLQVMLASAARSGSNSGCTDCRAISVIMDWSRLRRVPPTPISLISAHTRTACYRRD